MNKIAKLIKQGWIIDQIQFDRFQGWYYTGAKHETGEASVSGAGTTLTAAVDDLYAKAVTQTPQWYLEYLKAQS